MNTQTKKLVDGLVARLAQVKDEIEELQGEEQDKFDNLPEGLQAAESGQKLEASATMLGEAANSIDEAISSLEESCDPMV